MKEQEIEEKLIEKLVDLKYTYRPDIRDRAALEHIKKIIDTYQFRKEEDRYSLRVPMERIAAEGYNLNISRYISTSVAEKEIDLDVVNASLVEVESTIQAARKRHNEFLKELGLPPLV